MLVAICLLAAASPARADEVDDLVAKSEALGKQGEWTRAIATLKEADTKRPRALHACMIALAYTRREQWTQAEVFFARCHARASDGDQVPEWTREAEQQLAAKIADAAIPLFTIAATPPSAVVELSGFEPDETFAPGAIHLAPGHHTLRISAPNHRAVTRELDAVVGRDQRVEVALEPIVPPPTDTYRSVRWALLGVGVGLVVAGVIVDEEKLQPLRDDLAKSQLAYERNHGSFATTRVVTVGLFAGGAVALIAGGLLAYRHHRSDPVVSAAVERGGGSLTLTWER